MQEITIGNRKIGPGHPVYIIAEISANHNHNFDEALKLVDVAAEAGCDAVKLQTYTPDTITLDSDKEYFQVGKGTIWEGMNLYKLYGEAYTPWEWQPKIKAYAEEKGLHCFSSPFDRTSVDFLQAMHVDAYKIASFELVDIPLIKHVARQGKPVIMSTGMGTLSEIDEAVRALRSEGCEEFALLKCTSAYPSPPEAMNLRTIPHLSQAFGIPVGLSDHTLGNATAVASVALGACIIEKHITMSRDVPGPDSAFSLEPAELAVMVREVREAQAALGKVNYQPTEKELSSTVFRKSIFVAKDIAAGEKLTAENVRVVRPAHGLHPRHYDEVLGKVAKVALEKGTPLALNLLED
jgi:pseudaminic acid synthase